MAQSEPRNFTDSTQEGLVTKNLMKKLRRQFLSTLAGAGPANAVVLFAYMGHGAEYRDEFTRLSRRPVLLAQTLLAKVAAEVVGG